MSAFVPFELPSYRGYRYPAEIISHAVWLYFRFSLSLRAELVNPDETGRLDNYCVIGTSVGLLIQAGPGNAGGRGTWRTKRSGCAT